MKQAVKIGVGAWMILMSWMTFGQSKSNEQSAKDARMDMDIEVAENVLSTLIRQHMGRRNFLPVEVNGSYLPGYGITLRLPQTGVFMFMYSGREPNIVNISGNGSWSTTYSYSSSNDECEDCEREKVQRTGTATGQAKGGGIARVKAPAPKVTGDDSAQNSINKVFLEVAKNFLADYGDVISQLKPEERITITNQSDEMRNKFMAWGGNGRRTLLSAEAKYDDITQLKQGKISRDQFISRLKIVNTETSEEIAPDLEIFSSLMGRLYRDDLSKTYYSDGDVGYERLKDFGVIYYMRVYSSTEERDGLFFMPTVSMRDVSQEERDKKVKEMYPRFESELKENLVEYARTIKSLKDDEQVMLNVRLTKCTGCGIPATLELAVKYSALKDYNTGKATKEATIGKVSVKKGGIQ